MRCTLQTVVCREKVKTLHPPHPPYLPAPSEINECEATANEVLILTKVGGPILHRNISTEVRTPKDDPKLNWSQDWALEGLEGRGLGCWEER